MHILLPSILQFDPKQFSRPLLERNVGLTRRVHGPTFSTLHSGDLFAFMTTTERILSTSAQNSATTLTSQPQRIKSPYGYADTFKRRTRCLPLGTLILVLQLARGSQDKNIAKDSANK
jgi:hypothetical protein